MKQKLLSFLDKIMDKLGLAPRTLYIALIAAAVVILALIITVIVLSVKCKARSRALAELYDEINDILGSEDTQTDSEEEEPAAQEQSSEEEEPIVEEEQITEGEQPVVEEPAIEEEEQYTEDEPEPVEDELSVEEPEPVEEEIAIEDEPVVEEEPAIEEPIAEEEAVAEEEPTVEEEPAAEEESTAEEELATEEEQPYIEEPTVEEEQPEEEYEPIAEQAPTVEESAPVEVTVPTPEPEPEPAPAPKPIEKKTEEKPRRKRETTAVRYNVSFRGKVIMSSPAVQNICGEIADELIAYYGVEASENWRKIQFRSGKTTLANLFYNADKLTLKLAIDPAECVDIPGVSGGEKKRRDETPASIELTGYRSKLAAKKAIARMMLGSGYVKRSVPRRRDYAQPVATEEELAERGLARLIK